MIRTKTATLAGLAGALIALPALALATVNVGDQLGTTEAAIRAELEKEGYTITEFEMEHGEIEIYVTKDGQAFEIEVSDGGQILEIELEDEEDDKDDN